jgi:hypothetical protein
VEWLANRNTFLLMAVLFTGGLAVDRTSLPETTATALFLLAVVLPPLLMTVSTREDGYDSEPSHSDRLKLLLGMLSWSITPWGILTQVLQIGGTAAAYVRYLGRPPSRDRHVPETDLAAPFDGEWTTVNGGVTKETSHSWGLVAQRYAYDFVITDDEGDTHEGDGTALTDYYAYGAPIRAPADGTVVATEDGLRDYPRPGTGWIEWRTWKITGNYVVIEHADGEYSTLAHLREGSVRVAPGDTVERGEVIGECGNSGSSTEPHLHFQLQDRADFWTAAGLVPRFRDVTVRREDDRRPDHDVYGAAATAADGCYLWAGDRVGPAADAQ